MLEKAYRSAHRAGSTTSTIQLVDVTLENIMNEEVHYE